MSICRKFNAFIRNLTVLWSIPFTKMFFHSKIHAFSKGKENSEQSTEKIGKCELNKRKLKENWRRRKKIINMQRSLFINVNDVFLIQILAALMYSSFLFSPESIKKKWKQISFCEFAKRTFSYLCVPFHWDLGFFCIFIAMEIS